VKVQEDVRQDRHRARAAISWHAVPKNAAPDLSLANPITESRQHFALSSLIDIGGISPESATLMKLRQRRDDPSGITVTARR